MAQVGRWIAGVGGLVVAVGLGVVLYGTSDQAPKAVAATTEAAPTPPPRAARASAPERPSSSPWAESRERVRAARAERGAPLPSLRETPTAETCSEACWGTLRMQLSLASAVEDCAELRPAQARGTLRLRALVIAEPGVGAVIDEVELVDDPVGSTELRECIIESVREAELGDPSEPVADTFAFRYSVGAPADNAGDFLRDHPEVVQAHPELAPLLEAGEGPRSDEDATTFARVVSSDPATLDAFAEWSEEQGVDLAGVRAE